MRMHTKMLALGIAALALAACNQVDLTAAPEPTPEETGGPTPTPANPDQPIAIIASGTPYATLVTAQLDGSASYDPNNPAADAIASYDWTLLTTPPGSAAIVEPLGETASFAIDVAGTYEVQLIVTDQEGLQSEPALHAVDAIPLDQIHVELSWNTDDNDIDVHLLHQDANDRLFDLSRDCHFRNCILTSPTYSIDWGPAGSDTTDPSLDLDDRKGFGPENVNVETPENGVTYKASVHYYEDNGGGTSEARVRIFVQGNLVHDATQAISADQAWDVARIDWPSGTVTPVNVMYPCVTQQIVLTSGTCSP